MLERSELKEFRRTLRMGCLIMYWYLYKGLLSILLSSMTTSLFLSHIFISFIDLVSVFVFRRIGEV